VAIGMLLGLLQNVISLISAKLESNDNLPRGKVPSEFLPNAQLDFLGLLGIADAESPDASGNGNANTFLPETVAIAHEQASYAIGFNPPFGNQSICR
jgi:hypothetical protein